VSYHHGGDQHYYEAFSAQFHDYYDVVYDNSLDRVIDSENTDYVLQRIRDDFITGTSCTIVLVGAETHRRKYVDWEIKATLDKEHALIGLCLPTARMTADNKAIVPDRLYDNIASNFALWVNWGQTADNVGALQKYVAEARNRSTSLINNSREKMARNG